jgi:hypothetical protein
VVRFADKSRHQVFVEPEGIDHPELYMNGISTSLPVDVQAEILATLPGFEHARMARPGYAVEYDFFPPDQIQRTMESKYIENLYFAGQVNGTSGYEEAAAQGFVAGVNAVLKQRGEAAFVPGRDEAYIGVMIDDLTTRDRRAVSDVHEAARSSGSSCARQRRRAIDGDGLPSGPCRSGGFRSRGARDRTRGGGTAHDVVPVQRRQPAFELIGSVRHAVDARCPRRLRRLSHLRDGV